MSRRRDVLATCSVGVAVLLVVANVRGWGLPLVGGDRASALALGLVAVLLYAIIPAATLHRGLLVDGLGVLGVATLSLAVAGLLVGTHLLLGALLGVLAGVWLLLEARHLPPRTFGRHQ